MNSKALIINSCCHSMFGGNKIFYDNGWDI